MTRPLYLDTSAVLQAVLEAGASPETKARIDESDRLVTSRLSRVESARVFLRLRKLGELSEAAVADAENAVRSVWMRCEILELTETVCDLAEQVSPGSLLRALDALHLASYVLARRHIDDLELLTFEERLLAADEGL
ncbi:MAG: type II toxin-antitoxin system VapC family toxin [Gemmatimonadota bacterium]